MADLTYKEHFSKQAATFFVYLISLMTALTVNEMWRNYFNSKKRTVVHNILIAAVMIAAAIAVIAVISFWLDRSDDDEE